MAYITETNEPLRELALFAGAGGGILGGKLLGWETVCAVEWESFPASVLMQRQNDGFLPPFPIWDDVQTFDGKPWRGIVDVVSGGFPCQDISCAGKGAGLDGERSGLWGEMRRIIGEIRPQYAFVENSPMLVVRGLNRVLGDFAEMGYDTEWGVISAADCGAPHIRERIWILAKRSDVFPHADNRGIGRWQQFAESVEEKDVANPASIGDGGKPRDIYQAHGGQNGQMCWQLVGASKKPSNVADSTSIRQPRQRQSWFGSDPAEKRERETDRAFTERIGYVWGVESPVGRVAHGVANRMDRLKAIGNGQVSIVAATAWRILMERFNEKPYGNHTDTQNPT